MENYNVIAEFMVCGKDMIVVRLSGAACMMERHEYKRMIETQKRNAVTFL